MLFYGMIWQMRLYAMVWDSSALVWYSNAMLWVFKCYAMMYGIKEILELTVWRKNGYKFWIKMFNRFDLYLFIRIMFWKDIYNKVEEYQKFFSPKSVAPRIRDQRLKRPKKRCQHFDYVLKGFLKYVNL